MEEGLQLRCRAALKTLGDMRAQGLLADPVYFMAVVSIAYEYAVVDEMDVAVGMLLKVPIEYYEQHQAQQILDDPQYARVCAALAGKLLLAGLLDDHPITGAARA